MMNKLKEMLKNRGKGTLASAENDFDELMEKINEDQMDLSQLEIHMREEWDKIHHDVKEVKEDVDEAVNEKDD